MDAHLSSGGAVIRTSLGDIAVEFFGHAEEAVENFCALADAGLYDGNEFHYAIAGFIIQGGHVDEFTDDDYFPDEHDIDRQFDRPYLVATAGRLDLSHHSQFFITLREAPHLDWNHTIFGEVVDEASRRVVDAINAAETDGDKRPIERVAITAVTINGKQAAQ